jgi:uridine phosphorylase
MQPIAESELIINSRGAIYHLDVRPEELAHTIITVGDPFRVKEVSKHFDRIEVQREHREFITHTGYIGSKRLSVVSTGIGPDNIDIVLNELDALVNIDFSTRHIKSELTTLNIVRMGTSGSLQAHIPVDSFVASTHGLGLDNLLNYYRHEHNVEENSLLQSFITHTQLNQNITNPIYQWCGLFADQALRGRFPPGNNGYLPGFLRSPGPRTAPRHPQPGAH